MIHYQLRCGQDHEFDGWFKDSAAFDKQAERGLVACPTCGDVKVARAMMAPAVATRAAEPRRPPPPVPATDGAKTGAVAGPMPDHMRAMLQRMRAEVEKNCDNVGERFAEEALRIHHGEAEPRAIYGDATPEQAEGLADEGVRVTRIPWVPRAEG
ncbi:MAG: DUF1178 family protein [Acetobacteraceae bacterium]